MPTVQKNVSLKKFNTFGIDAKAQFFTEISSVEELKNILQNLDYQGINKLVLGGGSNLLLTKDFEGLVVKINIDIDLLNLRLNFNVHAKERTDHGRFQTHSLGVAVSASLEAGIERPAPQAREGLRRPPEGRGR